MVYWTHIKKVYKHRPKFNYKKTLKQLNFDKLKHNQFKDIQIHKKYVQALQSKNKSSKITSRTNESHKPIRDQA